MYIAIAIGDNSCAICMDLISFGNDTFIACTGNHIFHSNCIAEWINRTPTPNWPDGSRGGTWINSTTCMSTSNPTILWNSETGFYFP